MRIGYVVLALAVVAFIGMFLDAMRLNAARPGEGNAVYNKQLQLAMFVGLVGIILAALNI